jgi:small-conductance mechanosensitive channel
MVLRDRLNKRINREFEKHGIEIPFPQRDLHIKSSVVRTQELMPDRGSAEIPDRHTPAKVG